MKKQKFLIMWNDHGEKSIREQIGYIIQYDSTPYRQTSLLAAYFLPQLNVSGFQ